MNPYELPLEAAKECLEFTNIIVSKKPPEWKDDDFSKDLENLQSFLKISTDAEIEIITIPERHRRMATLLAKLKIMDTMFGGGLTE